MGMGCVCVCIICTNIYEGESNEHLKSYIYIVIFKVLI